MDHKNLMPIAAQPVNRITTGQLPAELAELSEEILSQLGEDASNSVLASAHRDLVPRCCRVCLCRQQSSYDGDDAE
jgi:bacteriocin leader peptide (microcyclamide/patellamide family)